MALSTTDLIVKIVLPEPGTPFCVHLAEGLQTTLANLREIASVPDSFGFTFKGCAVLKASEAGMKVSHVLVKDGDDDCIKLLAAPNQVSAAVGI